MSTAGPSSRWSPTRHLHAWKRCCSAASATRACSSCSLSGRARSKASATFCRWAGRLAFAQHAHGARRVAPHQVLDQAYRPRAPDRAEIYRTPLRTHPALDEHLIVIDDTSARGACLLTKGTAIALPSREVPARGVHGSRPPVPAKFARTLLVGAVAGVAAQKLPRPLRTVEVRHVGVIVRVTPAARHRFDTTLRMRPPP